MSTIQQNSLTMADFYPNGDNLFKKNLKEIEENLYKYDITLVKKDDNIFPTILTETGNFMPNFNKNESRNSKELKKQATITKTKSVIEEKKPVFLKNIKKTPSESKLLNKKDEKRLTEENDKKIQKNEKDKKKHKDKRDKKDQDDDKIVKIFTLSNDHSNTSSQSSFTEKLSIKKSRNDIKYSWHDISSWLSPSQKEEIDKKQKDVFHLKKIYSWEIFGIGIQTSNCSLMNIDASNYKSKHECSIKYSWQIIGKSTQASINNDENSSTLNDDYWQGSIIFPKKNYCSQKNINTEYRESSNNIRILHCERTQTSSDKETETDFTDCRIKYSWENLIQRHEKLEIMKHNKISYNNFKNISRRIEPLKCCQKYSWENLINQHLNQ